mmetsp:Transcript_9922/g.11863  ORF Transcript_9922/g.11863 Transcript_9922/m.11863 type:complete len:251 (-) Transcript_9922:41-793(-)
MEEKSVIGPASIKNPWGEVSDREISSQEQDDNERINYFNHHVDLGLLETLVKNDFPQGEEADSLNVKKSGSEEDVLEMMRETQITQEKIHQANLKLELDSFDSSLSNFTKKESLESFLQTGNWFLEKTQSLVKHKDIVWDLLHRPSTSLSLTLKPSSQRKLKEALETTAFEMSQFKERLKAVNTTKNATENARNLESKIASIKSLLSVFEREKINLESIRESLTTLENLYLDPNTIASKNAPLVQNVQQT